uniref:Acrosin-binding protein n=1 Tax=Xenopus tropicalis TaxID=8364 RepID=A0A6I8S594_XENTR
RWGPALGWRVVFPVVLLAQSNPALKFAITPGTPLSNKEYEAFFKPQKPKLRAIAVCKKRMAYGCDEPRIHRIDLWENHGNSPIGFISWLNGSLYSVIIKQYLYLIPTKI